MLPIGLDWREHFLFLIFPGIVAIGATIALIRFRRWSLAFLLGAALLNFVLMVADLAVLRFMSDDQSVAGWLLSLQPPLVTGNRGEYLLSEFPHLSFIPYVLWLMVIVGSIGEIVRFRNLPSTKLSEA